VVESDDEDFDLEIDLTSDAEEEEPSRPQVSGVSSRSEGNLSTPRIVYARGQTFEVVSIQRVTLSQTQVVESDDEDFDLEIDLTSDAEEEEPSRPQVSGVSMRSKRKSSKTTSKK